MNPRLALISVSDKTDLIAFARRLAARGFQFLSTGGSARALAAAGLAVREVAEFTGFPEILEGRVKTLHPRVHAGLLARPDHPEHQRQMRELGLEPIELLVVNLYPFVATAKKPGVGFEELIENIDIGGPTMVRAAAKNFAAVAVVTDPADYSEVAAEYERADRLSPATHWRLAKTAFERIAVYDAAIASALDEVRETPAGLAYQPAARDAAAAELPARLTLELPRRAALRYGENPHQAAALYAAPDAGGLAAGLCLQGKELSYNNWVDLDAAWQLAREFSAPAIAIIKHTNPAGCATAPELAEAWRQALACDPVSAFGGVVGVNRVLDEATAAEIHKLFVECIAAPGYTPEARAILAGKKQLRLLQVETPDRAGWQLRSISGGMLAQTPDQATEAPPWRLVTRRAPTPEEMAGLEFGWRVARHVKSNAIVLARGGQTLAVGAGQMSRVDSVKIAGMKARLPLAGASLASDAFFPFPDGIEEAARLGVTAVVQPGGSVKDQDAIAVCDRLGLAMMFTDRRHFRH